MLQSLNFKTTTFKWDGKEFEMEYDLSTLSPGSIRAFGNIYSDPEKKDDESTVQDFTFFTINNEIAGYTPMNGKREFIAAIAKTILGIDLTFSALL